MMTPLTMPYNVIEEAMTDPWGVHQADRAQHQQSPGLPERAGIGVVRPQRKNGVALAGAITSFIPIVGLVLSIVGRIRARSLGGAGATSGTVGIVLSIFFTCGSAVGIYELDRPSAADPGCIAYEQVGLNMSATMEADSGAMSSAKASGNPAQQAAASQKYLDDLKTMEAGTRGAEEAARRQDVRAAISKADNDMQLFESQFSQYIASGSGPATFMSTAENMITDGKAIMGLCGDVVGS